MRYLDIKLRPCPFCGFESKIAENSDGEGAYVQCMGVKFHRALWLDGDNNVANDVADAWNKRVDPNAPERTPS